MRDNLINYCVYVVTAAGTIGAFVLVDRLGVPEGFLKFFAQAALVVPMFLLIQKLAHRLNRR